MELAERGELKIIAAAIKVNKKGNVFVIAGKRHCNCFETIFLTGCRRPFDEIQGFLTNEFEFVDRKEAWKIAEASGQIKEAWKIAEASGQIKEAEYPGTLFGEDLW